MRVRNTGSLGQLGAGAKFTEYTHISPPADYLRSYTSDRSISGRRICHKHVIVAAMPLSSRVPPQPLAIIFDN